MIEEFYNHIYDPHATLGLREKSIRLWRPDLASCFLELKGKIVEAAPIQSGLFEFATDEGIAREEYRIYLPNGKLVRDPYTFLPQLGELDLHLFSQGVHYELYNHLGAKVREIEGIKGTLFCVWAPNAKSVHVVGDFNHWDDRIHPLRSLGFTGLWELFIPGVEEGTGYKFAIRTNEGECRYKIDPVAHFAEMRPKDASRVFDVSRFSWSDQKWMETRHCFRNEDTPINVYEVHLGSWKKENGCFLNYKAAAHLLADYCLEMGYTHVELMGVCEHPLDESWGYQITGFFAPTSRFGTPEDFQYFVNHLHNKNIGVFLDWVPSHFPTDDNSLARFDGTHLYEHQDSRQGYHPHWNTLIFNYGRVEVVNFLIASALFWFDKMHIDGLRVDAVASMLYLDYGRNEGEWIPNQYGNNFNLEAITFLKHLNSIIHHRFPDVLMIAEESTAFSGVTKSVEEGGLGFDLKWNMGWMNDTLSFMTMEFGDRPSYFQSKLTFVMWYAFCEKFLLVLSHDEVVHGKRSLLAKMPGFDWDKFAGLRLMISFMICMPGKKLLFMGAELGQWSEWDCTGELHWYLLQYDRHSQHKACIQALNKFYLSTPALHKGEFHWGCFEWVDFHDGENLVISYLRKEEGKKLLCLHHFKLGLLENYRLKLRNVKNLLLLLNTDRAEWGGSGKMVSYTIIDKEEIELTIPSLATLVFEVQFFDENS